MLLICRTDASYLESDRPATGQQNNAQTAQKINWTQSNTNSKQTRKRAFEVSAY